MEEVPLNNKIKNKYTELIHKRLETKEKVPEDEYESDYFLNPIIQYFELINSEVIKDKKLMSLNIETELFKFLIDPENYNKDEFDVEWLKFFYNDSFINRFSKINYIIEILEDYLIENNNETLNKVYFKLKKKTKRNKI
jgi:hypothetical protein